MSASVSSLLPTTQPAPHDMVSVSNSTQSLVTTNKTQVSSIINDIESFANSDLFSKSEALRREDGSLRIFVTAKDWDRGTIAEDLADPDSTDEIAVSASRKYDSDGGHFIFAEVRRFRDKENNLVEKHTVSINSSGKVKTSFPADRKFEVLNAIDALKSTVRRLLELELYKDRGMLSNHDDSEAVLQKLHVYDNFDPGKNPNNLTDEQWKDMEHQLSDISKILQMVE